MLSFDHGPARSDPRDLAKPVTGPVWLEPWPDELPTDDASDPAAAYLRRESVELAFVAALQQRAALGRRHGPWQHRPGGRHDQ
jgi:hypothetical protein